MSMNLMDVMRQTNWALLRAQKIELLALTDNPEIAESSQTALEGIINWIDSIQDAAVEEGIPETEVFGACLVDNDDD